MPQLLRHRRYDEEDLGQGVLIDRPENISYSIDDELFHHLAEGYGQAVARGKWDLGI